MKYDKETDEEGKRRGVSMERSEGTKEKRSPGGKTIIINHIIIKNIICSDFIIDRKSAIKSN